MRVLLFAVLLLQLAACAPERITNVGAPRNVDANDNRKPAGTMRDRVRTVQLEIVEGDWQPDHSLAPIRVLAFAEAGHAPTTPGPLIRIAQGTWVDASVSNRTDHAIWLHGMHARPGQGEALEVPAHGSIATRFRADTPGSYYYFGTPQEPAPRRREGVDSALHGALIVDAAGQRSDDRVFVIAAHGDDNAPFFWTINGRSWPDTERLSYTVGEQVAWRWINTSMHSHPMHMHGTYFTVTSSGDNWLDVPIEPAQRQLAVTHLMEPGATMALTWSPQRLGNWLFHCHLLYHVMPENRLSDSTQWFEEYADLPHDQHMAGLVLGMHVLPAQTRVAERASDGAPRRLTLRVGARDGTPYTQPGLSIPRVGYALDDGPVTAPGPALILERGRPVEIAIVNNISHATAVHWHGVELESYYDGVPHMGGDGNRTTPLIEPGGSFTARFTPPRAGTFIYHTHFNDFIQLTGGLYGALVVVERAAAFDPATDHAFVISLDGADDTHDAALLNGAGELSPVIWHVGQRHRLRFIDISAASDARVRLTRDDAPVSWRAIAKDGADLPAQLATAGKAELEIFPGETYDFEFDADAPGDLRLEVALPDNSGPRAGATFRIER
jgi:FtsP/CotA-like multicopper oxidase with cupredoxin domain